MGRFSVIPAEAGIALLLAQHVPHETPAFAGVTVKKVLS